MDASPTPPQLDRVLQVQHLVKEDVFDSIARHTWVVEDTADDDGIVRGIVVTEAATGVVLAPGELRTSHESVKEAAVEVVEDFFQMVVVAASGADVLASAHLADETRFGGNIMAGDIAAITCAVDAIDWLAIELGEQDVGNRVQDRFWSTFEQVGEADVEFSLAHADGVVDGDKRIKADVHDRRGRARTQFAIGFMKDFGELWGHVEGRLADRPLANQQLANQRIVLALFVLFFLLHVLFDLGDSFPVVVGAGVHSVEGVGQEKFVLAGFSGIGVRGVLDGA